MSETERSSGRAAGSSLTANRLGAFIPRVPDTFWQLGFLFLVDMFTNGIDFFFHVFLGRSLSISDFAVVQTVNSVILIMVTAFAVLQPVVARFVAQAAVDSESTPASSIFQAYFRQSLLIGIILTLIGLLFRHSIAGWLNIPVGVSVVMIFMTVFALIRPVVAGMLQGLQRFVAYGLTRTVFAATRFAAVLLMVGLAGGGAVAGVLSMPLGGLVALLAGLIFLGSEVWQKSDKVSSRMVLEGWQLSIAALLAYGAFMGLQNNDLIWVNRLFEGEVAGAYASVVVLRRILVVLPGAVIIILYPRVVTKVAQGILPDSTLAKAAAVVLGAGAVITLVFFAFGSAVINIVFGPGFEDSATLLGWMAIAMMGFGLAVIWLNLFLATKPWPFVGLLLVVLLGQTILLALRSETVQGVTTIFGLSGWILALGGLVLYLAWLRPVLIHEQENRGTAGGL